MQNNKGEPLSIHGVMTGVVLSDKMEKTRIVQIVRLTKHPKYKKVMKRYSKFKVHDEKNISKAGETVKIAATRPISKEKRWRILEVVKK